MHPIRRFIGPTTLALFLAGCGGGGGASSPPGTTSPTPTPLPVTSPTALQTAVLPPTYATGTAQATAWATLDAARQAMGVGSLTQASALDMAAQAHAAYITTAFGLGQVLAANHAETPGQAGFTGISVADRVRAANFSGQSVTEGLTDIIEVDGVTQNEPGVVAVQSLLSGPYHRLAMLSGARQIGIGHSALRSSDAGGVHQVVVVDLGIGSGQAAQSPAADWVGVWPVDGAKDVLYGFPGESPDPIPVLAGQCGGYPISVQVIEGHVLTTTSLTLTDTATGNLVPMQVSTPAQDANPAYAKAYAVYAIPFKPLKLGTSYTARFEGANDGTPITKRWQFTTINQDLKRVYGCSPG